MVGGAVRDELLGRPSRRPRHRVPDPRAAAVAYARRSQRRARFRSPSGTGLGGSRSTRARTVDFTPLRGTIEDDLATRDFTINAIAVPLAGGEPVDPFGGRRDLDERSLRPVSASSSRTTRCGCCGRSASSTSSASGWPTRRWQLIRAASPPRRASRRASGSSPSWTSHSRGVPAARRARPARSRSAAPWPISATRTLRRSGFRASSAASLERFPISNEQQRLLRTVLRAERPRDDSPRGAAPVPPRDRALGARGARASSVPGAPAAVEMPGARSRRAARARRRARHAARAPRSVVCSSSDRGGASRRHDLDARGGARARPSRTAGVTHSARRRQTSARISPLGSQREGGRANLAEDDAERHDRNRRRHRRLAASAEQLGRLTEERADALRERVRRFVPLSGDERALDAGTGTGALAFALSPFVREVVARRRRP